jgi:hypothetical protein
MKRFTAGALTIVVMGVLLWSGARRAPQSLVGPTASEAGARPASPSEERVHALLASAEAGDVSAYLDSFTGAVRQRLEREVNERGRRAFADDLRRAARVRKSHAVFASEPDGPDAALVTVETVYPDRNESRSYRVSRGVSGWLVSDVATVRSHQPPSKFGAPAVFVAPEGVPVQGGLAVESGDESVGAGEAEKPEGR